MPNSSGIHFPDMSEDGSSLLQDLSLNTPAPAFKTDGGNKTGDSSLGLLDADAIKNISAFSDYDLSKENLQPTNNMSLGQYLQPGGMEESLASQPLSDSEEEEEAGVAVEERSGGFSWDQVVQANTGEEPALQQSVQDSCVDDWQAYQDPSFCSGKFSARSTSFGGLSNTRDENFSDFSKVPSFQGSYVSHCSTKMEESVWRSGHTGLPGTQSGLFQGVDLESQADLGLQFGEEEFGSLGKDQLENFFENEEAECLKENPFIEEEQCEAAEAQSNSSLMSGVSDKSIMLRNSNLWGGDTTRVDLEQLRREETKVSRCEYFRHNSSRLGALDESVEDSQRPDLGFFHNIRSPERKPCALLSESKCSPASSKVSMSGTFSVDQPDGQKSGDSTPSSTNSTYMASGDSTKTVVSLSDQPDTLKAAELVSRLQSLATQLGSQSPAPAASYPDVVEDSICSTSRLEESIRETLDVGSDINISTISKVLSEASISSDPQHFVNVILGCLKNKAGAEPGGEKPSEEAAVPERERSQEKQTKKISFGPTLEPQSIKMSQAEKNVSTPKISSLTLPKASKPSSSTPGSGRLSHTPTAESRRAMLRLSPTSLGSGSRKKPVKKIKPWGSSSEKTGAAHVVPVKPQVCSAPGSARNTPTPPPLVKSESFPSSLNTSSKERRRKLSGTRHSSPIKKVEIVSPPARTLMATPTSTELSRLLDTTDTPQVQVTAASHLTTSTPFHPNTNLSLVMLDHLTHNTSVSPLVNPDTSICPVSLDVSTISPALYTSVLKVNKNREAKIMEKVEMLPDWSQAGVVPSHTKIVVSIPVINHIINYSNCIVKITNVWVGSLEVPSDHWQQIVSFQRETLVLLQHDTKTLDIEMELKKGGAFTFNVGLMMDSGISSSGLVRLQAEEPNIQVLTSDGKNLDFGLVPLNSSASAKLMLVNCGLSSVPLYLELAQSSQVFSFDDGSQQRSLSLPGVESESQGGTGVLSELSVLVNTAGLAVTELKVFRTDLSIVLGADRDGTVLGTMEVMARVRPPVTTISKNTVPAKPALSFGVMKKPEVASQARAGLPSAFPVESDRFRVNFFCVGLGLVESQSITLRNSTNSLITLSLIIRDTTTFLLEGGLTTRQLQLQPRQTQEVQVTFCPQRAGTEQGKLVLKPQGVAVGGKSYKASIALCGVAGQADITMEGLVRLGEDQYQLNFQEGSPGSTVTFTNTGQCGGFVKILSDSNIARSLDISATAFILGPNQSKKVNISHIGDFGVEAQTLQLTIVQGPELARLVMKKARKLPGGSTHCDTPAALGFNYTEEFPGENLSCLEEAFKGQELKLTAMDVKHFFKKISKKCVSVMFPSKPVEFNQLCVEETLSETRIDQSIALPLSSLQPAPVSPPNTDGSIKISPERLVLTAGEESLLRLTNLSIAEVHWDVAWPGSRLSLSPGSGLLMARGEAVLCVRAAPGGSGWRGQIQVYTDNNLINIEVVIAGDQPKVARSVPSLVLSVKQLSLNSPRLGQSSSGEVTVTNPSKDLVQWRAILQPSFFSLPLSSGILKPAQSVTVAVLYKPGALGQHQANLTITSQVVRGGQETPGTTTSNTVTLQASCGRPETPGSKTGKPGGTVRLERDQIVFPNTRVGELSIAKVKIENRSGADRVIEILPLPSSAFRTVHTVVEVKSRCFTTVPIHFKPTSPGEHLASVNLRWEGNLLSASLQGKGIDQ